MKKAVYLFIFSLLLISCNETQQVIDIAGNVQLSGTYNVNSINGNQVTKSNPSINFVALDKTIRGNTGCNSFFGKYALDLYALSFAEIGSTEMACDSDIMDTENAFMNALNNTGSYGLENGILTLYSKVDRSVLLTATKERKEGN